MKTKTGLTVLVVTFVVGLIFTACPPPWMPPPPPGVVVGGGVPLPPLPPPPPFVLLPAPVVVYSDAAGCDYVSGVDYDVFYVDGYFYTHHSSRWFCTHRPGVAWVVVESAYVPTILIPGPPRPGWRGVTVGPGRRVTSFRGTYPFPTPPGKAVGAAKLKSRSGGEKPIKAVKSSKGKLGDKKIEVPVEPKVRRPDVDRPLKRPKVSTPVKKIEPVSEPVPAVKALPKPPAIPAVKKVTPTPTPKPTPTLKITPKITPKPSTAEPTSDVKPKAGRASGKK